MPAYLRNKPKLFFEGYEHFKPEVRVAAAASSAGTALFPVAAASSVGTALLPMSSVPFIPSAAAVAAAAAAPAPASTTEFLKVIGGQKPQRPTQQKRERRAQEVNIGTQRKTGWTGERTKQSKDLPPPLGNFLPGQVLERESRQRKRTQTSIGSNPEERGGGEQFHKHDPFFHRTALCSFM